jgi:hypothetical protein
LVLILPIQWSDKLRYVKRNATQEASGQTGCFLFAQCQEEIMSDPKDQEQVLLGQLGEQIQRAHALGDVERAAYFAAQAYNVVHPDRPVEVPQISEEAEPPRRPPGFCF